MLEVKIATVDWRGVKRANRFIYDLYSSFNKL
jgi:hypothetical protein